MKFLKQLFLIGIFSFFGVSLFAQKNPLPEPSTSAKASSAIKVTILSATAMDKDANCGNREAFEFYSKVQINGINKRSPIEQGQQINPNWEFEGPQIESHKNDVKIWLFDQDKMGCGNRDDVVDITPEGIESGLILNIDTATGRIYQLVEKAKIASDSLSIKPALKLSVFGYRYSPRTDRSRIKEDYVLIGRLGEVIESVSSKEIPAYFFQRGSIKFKVELL